MKVPKSLFLFCSALILLAGKKDLRYTHAAGNITATVGGITQSFNINAAASIVSAGNTQELSIGGLQNLTVHSYGISIIINPADGKIAAGTYTSGVNSNDVQLGYSQTSTNLSYQNSNTDDASNAAVVITALTGTKIQGTFSGNLVLQTGSGPETIVVSSGTFNVPIQ
jgi:hypothetical protein